MFDSAARARITSGDPPVKKWEISSPCFTKESFVGASEKASLNPAKHRIHFQLKYEPGEARDVCITLKMEYYSGFEIAPIPYRIFWSPEKQEGLIDGSSPLGPTAEPLPGTLGAAISLITALGLTLATRGRFSIV